MPTLMHYIRNGAFIINFYENAKKAEKLELDEKIEFIASILDMGHLMEAKGWKVYYV